MPSAFHPPTFRLRYLLLLLLPAALFAYTPDEFFLPRPPLDDPFPIRRVYLSPEKFREQLAKDPDRVVVSLSAREFADRLRAAPRAVPPGTVRLVEQRYRASLVGDALAGGGEWKIVHSGKGAALLDVEPLSLALRESRWSDNRPLLMFPREAGGYKLLSDRPGELSMVLDWSLRGVEESGLLRFEIGVPICPLASVELELPAGLVPVVSQTGVVVSEPMPGAAKDTLVRRISFGGISRLDLALRDPKKPPPPGTLPVCRSASTHEIVAGEMRSRIELDIEVPQGELDELVLECDPDLTIADIVNTRLTSREALPERRQSLKFRDGFRGGKIVVSGVGPAPTAETPKSIPRVRPAKGIDRQEAIEVTLAAGEVLRELSPGSFLLRQSEILPDGSRRWRLVTGPTLANEPAVRPTLRVGSRECEYRVAQDGVLDVRRDRLLFDSTLSLGVVRGSLRTLPVRLPAGWEVEEIATSEGAVPWIPRDGNVLIDLPKPLSGIGEAQKLRVRLKQTSWSVAPEALLRLPDLKVPDAAVRSGTFRWSLSDGLVAAWLGDPAPPPDAVGPAPSTTDRVLAWETEPPAGALRVRLQSAEAATTAEASLWVLPGEPSPEIRYRLTFKPEPPAGSSLPLRSRGLTGVWDWELKTVGGGGLPVVPTRLSPVLGAVAAFGAPPGAVLAARMPLASEVWSVPIPADGERIRGLTLTRRAPSVARGLIAGAAGMAPPDIHDRLPTLSPVRGGFRGEAVSLLPGYGVRSEAGEAARSPLEWADPETALHLHELARPAPEASAEDTLLDGGRLTTAVLADGAREVLLQLRVVRCASQRLPVGLPAGAVVRGATLGSPAMQVEYRTTDDGIELVLPPITPANPSPKSGAIPVRIGYSLPATGRVAGDSPLPKLPGRLIDLRRFWQVHPAWRPLFSGLLLRLDDEPGGEIAVDPGLSESRRPSSAGRSPTIRSALQKLARDGVEPVVDTQALAAAGLTPQSVSVMPPSWAGFGLAAVQMPGFALISTPQALSYAGGETALSAAQMARIADVRRQGHDGEGRYRSLAEWLDSADAPDDTPLPDGPDWATWESAPGVQNPRFVRPADLAWLGIALAAGAMLLQWVSWLPKWSRRVGLLAGVALALTAVLVVPGGSGLRLGLPLLVLALLREFRRWLFVPRAAAPGPGTSATAAVALVFVLALSLGAGAGAPAEGWTVWYVGDVADPAAIRTVVVPQALLDELERPRPEVVLPATVARSAEWVGSVEGGLLRLDGTLTLWNATADGELTLNTGGGRLREVLIDGAAAFPTNSGADRIAVRIPGKGEHTLLVRLGIPVAEVGPEREVRLSVAETPASRMKVKLPKAAKAVQLVNHRGLLRESVQDDAPLIELDPGRSRSVVLRWQEGADLPPRATIRETHLWLLTPGESTLVSEWDYRTTQGRFARCEFRIPAGLEVTGINIQPRTLLPLTPLTPLRSWKVSEADGERRLKVDAREPLSGAFAVRVRFAPSAGPSLRPTLAFPSSVDVGRDGVPAESLAGVCVDGLTLANATERNALVDLPAENFPRDARRTFYPGVVLPPPALVARTAPGAWLKPTLTKPFAVASVDQEVAWLVGLPESSLSLTARCSSLDDRGLVEWTLPPNVLVRTVSGTGVLDWTRFGARLQVWLAPATRSTAVRVDAVWRRTSTGEQTDLPVVVPVDAARATSRITLKPQTGLQVSTLSTRNLTADESFRGGVRLTAVGTDFDARLSIRPDAGSPAAPVAVPAGPGARRPPTIARSEFESVPTLSGLLTRATFDFPENHPPGLEVQIEDAEVLRAALDGRVLSGIDRTLEVPAGARRLVLILRSDGDSAIDVPLTLSHDGEGVELRPLRRRVVPNLYSPAAGSTFAGAAADHFDHPGSEAFRSGERVEGDSPREEVPRVQSEAVRVADGVRAACVLAVLAMAIVLRRRLAPKT